ncbi:MAG: regulatory protein RecX [Solirubrobacterales bacterium]
MTGRRADPLDAALRAIARKERTTAELLDWLRLRDFSAEEAQIAVEELIEAGGLDDERFARRFADDKRELRGWGAERIADTLASRGIAAELIETALECDTDARQAARASDLLLREERPLAGESDRAKALGFLARRGYGLEVAHEAIRLAARRSGEARSAA